MKDMENLVNITTPYAWDDSMSLYEVIGRIVERFNEFADILDHEVQKTVTEQVTKELGEFTEDKINEFINSGQIVDMINQSIMDKIQELDVITPEELDIVVARLDSTDVQLAENVQRFENIEQQLEDGTAGIDDSVISDNKVWSSSKTQEQIHLIPKGEQGFSAYELWLNEGNEGTIDDFYRNALRFFFLETEPTNPQEGDVWFIVPAIGLIDDYLFRFDAMSLGLNDGEQVATWVDLSENGNNLVATNSIYRPIFSSTGFNGKPTVEFVESHLDINPFLLDKNDGVTMFIVGKFDDISSSATPLMIGTKATNTINDPVIQVRMSSSSKTITTNVNNIASTPLTPDLNEFLYTHTCDMETQKVWQNGVLRPSSPYTGGVLGTHNILRVGTRATTGVDQFKGKISEIIYFSRALSDTEISEMNAYLIKKWGI